MSDPNEELSSWIKQAARTIGFNDVGIAPATIGLGSDRLASWLAAGKHGEMEYMQRNEHVRNDPNYVLKGVRSVIMTALVYRTEDPKPAMPKTGRVSSYAWGSDYHRVLREKLRELGAAIVERDGAIRYRTVVDSAPVMERDYAQLAGIGWIGKNTLLLNKRLGSWFFLGGLLIDRELAYDVPFSANHCGTCTRCLDACPTDAFDGPYELDPRRCISYLTIEHQSAIPNELHEPMGDWLFGCDICQDVCPWNTKSEPSNLSAFKPTNRNDLIGIDDLESMTENEFNHRFQDSPILRTGLRRLQRNGAIVSSNGNKASRHEVRD